MRLLSIIASLIAGVLTVSTVAAQAPDPTASPRATAKQAAKDLETLTRLVLEADRSGMSEEELQQLQFIERSLPMLQQGLRKYSTMLKENPDMRPAVQVLDQVLYFNQLKDMPMREQLEQVLEPLLMHYAEKQELKPDVEETKGRLLQKKMPSQEHVDEIKAREADIVERLQDDTLSFKEMEALGEELDQVTEARRNMENLLAAVQQAGDDFYIGMGLMMERRIMRQRALEKIKEESKRPNLYKTSQGAEPVEAYIWFLNKQEIEGNLDYIYVAFKRNLEKYLRNIARTEKIEQLTPEVDANTPG